MFYLRKDLNKMKFFDKFLKILKTDKNTFFTYILTLLAIYFSVDRLVEIMLMVITGVSASYWGPIQYTIALACPIFVYLFCCLPHTACCTLLP